MNELTWNKRMKVARAMEELTQAQAAKKIGVSLRTYIRWEKGETKPKFGKQTRVKEALGIPEKEYIFN